MRIPLSDLFVAQSNLKRLGQISHIVESIKNNEYVEPIKVSEIEEDQYRVEDGTHRSVAYLISGRTHLEDGEYEIVPVNYSRATKIPLQDLANKILSGL
jgi:ParB-like chromosome segregation protein Spo0J